MRPETAGVQPVRVVLADADLLVRSLLRVALSARDVTIVGETGDLHELRELCVDELPAVVVTNANLDGGPIDGSLAALAACGARVLVLTTDPSPERLTHLLGAGVSGYLLREVAHDAVLDAVRAVAAGQVPLHPTAAATVVDQWRRFRENGPAANDRLVLTTRELEVLAAMADGLSTKGIAGRLGVAVKTVENHKTRVFDKLGVRSQAHAVATAIGQGLLADLAVTESV